MSDLLEKCAVCLAVLDEEDLFCANCGREAPDRKAQEHTPATQTSTHNFNCGGCGASMSYDASARTLRCPFCGSERLEKQKEGKTLAPEWIVPFAVSHEQAVATMREFLGTGFWRPGDLARTAVVTHMTAVYVPYWVFSARTFTYWCADTNQTPPGARGDWRPMAGEHRGTYSGVLIGASSTLTPGETSAICPFELNQAKSPEEIDTENYIVEQFRVQRKYARPLARNTLERFEQHSCMKYVPGRARNMHVNVRLEGLSSVPVLVPVWVMAYGYKGRIFRFLVNGQSGRSTGQAPFSKKKLFMIIGIVLLVILAILLCVGAFGGLAAATGAVVDNPFTRLIAGLAGGFANMGAGELFWSWLSLL